MWHDRINHKSKPDLAMNERFTQGHYHIRRKVFKIVGGAFHIFNQHDELMFYTEMKAFKLREDIRLYADEGRNEEMLQIHARHIVDFSATYDVIDSHTDEVIGSLRRFGGRSILRDEWGIYDADERQFGSVVEDSMMMALVRRFVSTLIPQTFHAEIDGREAMTIRQRFNPFVLKADVEFNPEGSELLDPRLGIAAAVLLLAIEGRQG